MSSRSRRSRNSAVRAAKPFIDANPSINVTPRTAFIVGRFNKRSVYKPPLAITDCTVFMEADVGVTQSGGLASNWADQSPYGNNTSTASGSQRPTYNSSPPYLQFDGSVGATYLQIPNSTSTSLVGNNSVFCAVQTHPFLNSLFAIALLSKANNTTGAEYYLYLKTQSTLNKMQLDRPYLAGAVATGNTVIQGSTNYTIGTIIRGAGSNQLEYWLNGAVDGTTSIAAGAATTNGINIGAYNPANSTNNWTWNGRFFALAIYSNAIDQDEAAAIHWYFNKRFYS